VAVDQVNFSGFGGLRLVADVRGDPDANPVLFLHGAGQTRHAWGRTAGAVAANGWRAVSLDMRGHGESDWAPDGDYSFAAFVADCAAVVQQLGRPSVLVGASLGGITSLIAEGTAVGEFSVGLVLVDITSHTNPSGVARIRNFMRSGVDGFDSLDDAARAIAEYTPQRRRQASPDGLRKVLRERDGRWYWHWDPNFIAASRKAALDSEPGQFRGVTLREITIPTMLVRGMMSDVVTDEGVSHLLSLIPSIEVVDVEGASHMVAGDKNDAFSDAILSFLDHKIGHSLEGTVPHPTSS
jgi:pimeloyl-ACP methyl ester carboxylesterase